MKVDFVGDQIINLIAENDLERRFLTKLNLNTIKVLSHTKQYRQVEGIGLTFKLNRKGKYENKNS